MSKVTSLASIMILIAFLFVGCNSSPTTSPASSPAASPSPSISHKSPSDVVKIYYEVANKGNYSEAAKYVPAKEMEPPFSVDIKDRCDYASNNGTMDHLEIISEKVRGEGAEVTVIVYFKDGTTREVTKELIKVDGDWKVKIL